VTLRTGTPEQVQRMFDDLNVSVKGILQDMTSIAFYMRGGIQYDDLWFRTPIEKEVIREFIEKHLKEESKHMFPQY
jgi:hypothetical protein